MASTSEASFGARLRRLQDAVEFINGWENYAPPRTKESPDGLRDFIAAVIAVNSAETAARAAYTNATTVRQEQFTGKKLSVKTLLISIRGAVEAQFGKTGPEAKQVAAIIANMRKNGLIKLPADPADPSKEKKISQSEQSYGSRTKYFTDIVDTLQQLDGYTSANPDFTIDGLKAKVAQLHQANNAVAETLQKIRSVRNSRLALYDDMADRMNRIKSYAKSQYGNRSAEYRSLISLG